MMQRHSLIARLVVLLLFALPMTSSADCARDAGGLVHCSKHPSGGAAKDAGGLVHCGKGQCRRGGDGLVYCSKVPGGGAETDAIEFVQCLGGCERGDREVCVRGDR